MKWPRNTVAGLFFLALSSNLFSQSSLFTYAGRLNLAGAPANGLFDFRITVYPVQVNGTPVAAPRLVQAVDVRAGVFTLELDFGKGVFDGSPRWLEVAVRATRSVDNFTVLSPRQPVRATAYALHANHATTADQAESAVRAERATTAERAGTADRATSAESARTATTATNALTALTSITATTATNAITATRSTTATTALAANVATNALTANFATAALTAGFATNASAANFAAAAVTAGLATNALTATFAAAALNSSLATNALTANVATAFTGPVSDAQLSANIPKLNGNALYTGTVSAAGFNGNGAGLTSVPARALVVPGPANIIGWGLPAIPTTPPTLTIRYPGNIVLSWPISFRGFVLETTDTLSAPNWRVIPHHAFTGENSATIEPTGMSRFFRLRR